MSLTVFVSFPNPTTYIWDGGGLGSMSREEGLTDLAMFIWNHGDSGEEKRSTCKYRTVYPLEAG